MIKLYKYTVYPNLDDDSSLEYTFVTLLWKKKSIDQNRAILSIIMYVRMDRKANKAGDFHFSLL